jgi:hypothetical protein
LTLSITLEGRKTKKGKRVNPKIKRRKTKEINTRSNNKRKATEKMKAT